MSSKSLAIAIADQNGGVFGFKLSSGETVIAGLLDIVATAATMGHPWKLEQPLQVLIGGPQGPMLFPWLPIHKDAGEILVDLTPFVVAVFTPDPALIEAYEISTGKKRVITPPTADKRIII